MFITSFYQYTEQNYVNQGLLSWEGLVLRGEPMINGFPLSAAAHLIQGTAPLRNLNKSFSKQGYHQLK